MKRFQHMSLIAATFAIVLASGSNAPMAGNASGNKQAANSAATESDSAAKIVRLDSAFDNLAPAGVKVEKLVDGHQWVEGPVWNRKEGYLLFSDIPNNAIIKWQEGKGEGVFMRPAG